MFIQNVVLLLLIARGSVPGQACPGENAALNKPARQSSNYIHVLVHGYHFPLLPSFAVDGCLLGWADALCMAHTLYEWSPWWQVDLQENHLVEEVIIYRRKDLDGLRTKGFDVRVGMNEVITDTDTDIIYVNDVADFLDWRTAIAIPKKRARSAVNQGKKLATKITNKMMTKRKLSVFTNNRQSREEIKLQ